MYVFVRSDLTSGSWWPVCPCKEEFSWLHNEQYKIFGQVYSADTMVFREQWQLARDAIVWDAISK